MFYMTNRLGAWQAGGDSAKGAVEFKLFFPKDPDPEITSIRVAGDFQSHLSKHGDWSLGNGFELSPRQTKEGTFWSYKTSAELPSGFYQYKYLVSFRDGSQRIVSDPCTRYGGTDNQNAAFVIGGSSPKENVVRPLKNGRRHLRDLIIYEMHIDDFTDEYREDRAPLRAIIERLDYLQEMGFNAILFMPWTSWKNLNFDWGYEPFQYFAVEYRYANDLGQPAEKISLLKRLISECHDRDIHVIMDGVFNHVSVDFPYKFFYRDPVACPYAGTFGGTFDGLQDLNFNNQCTQDFIRDVCLYWIDTFGIDGIRFDNTTNFYLAGDPRGLVTLLSDIRQHVAGKGEDNFSLTLEHIDISAAALTDKTAATSYWDNGLYESCFGGLWSNNPNSKLLGTLHNSRFLASQDKVPTAYLSNHDHSHITWQAGAKSNEGAMRWHKVQPYIIALYTGTGAPMIQNGQEFGEDHWIPENDQKTGRRVVPRPLRWKGTNDEIGKGLSNLHRRLAQIRHQYPGLRSRNFYPAAWEDWQTRFNPEGYGLDTERQIAIYHRWGLANGTMQRFIIVLNFSDTPQWITVPFPENGVWTDLLSGYSGTWKPEAKDYRLHFEVGSNWGHIFCR